MAARGVKAKKKSAVKGVAGTLPSLPSAKLANLKQALEAVFDRFNLGHGERHAGYAKDRELMAEAESRLRRWRLERGNFLDATVPLIGLTQDGVRLLASYAAALEAENRQLTNVINGDRWNGYGDLVKWITAQAKPKWSHRLSDKESVKRKKASKHAYDSHRAHKKCVGCIERELREAIEDASAPSPFQIGMPKGPPFQCLDDLLKGGTVRLATGSNNLCDLFGMGRKSLPTTGDRIKQGRLALFDYHAVLRIAGALLDSGKWLADPKLKLRRAFLMKLSRQTKRIAAPQHIADAVAEFIKERLRKIRDSKA